MEEVRMIFLQYREVVGGAERMLAGGKLGVARGSKNGSKAPERWVRSTCPYCGVGCGVEVGTKGGRVTRIRGDKAHPANFGKLCPKPASLPEAVHSPDRLAHPLRKTKGGKME